MCKDVLSSVSLNGWKEYLIRNIRVKNNKYWVILTQFRQWVNLTYQIWIKYNSKEMEMALKNNPKIQPNMNDPIICF